MTSNPIEIGTKAPDFSLPGDSDSKITLSSLKGKKVVLYFYPKDDTPGCTQEAKDFRDLIKEFEAANTVVIGMSKDSPKKHDKFKEKYDLPFSLASDEEGSILDKYGVWIQKSMYGKKYMGIERATFLINEEGIISEAWRDVKVKDHAQEVLSKVKSA